MLLPILAPLVAKVLAIFMFALEIVPTRVPIFLKIVATQLALVGSLVPGIAPVVNSLAPFVIAI